MQHLMTFSDFGVTFLDRFHEIYDTFRTKEYKRKEADFFLIQIKKTITEKDTFNFFPACHNYLIHKKVTLNIFFKLK